MVFISSVKRPSVAVLWKCIWGLLLLSAVSGVSPQEMTVTSTPSTTTEESSTISSTPLFTITHTSSWTDMNTTQSAPSINTVPFTANGEQFNTSFVTMATNESEFICGEQHCERKCCPDGQLFDTEMFSCKNVSFYGINIMTDHDLDNKSIVGFEAMRERWITAEVEKNITCGYFSAFDMSILNGFRNESKKLSFTEDFSCDDKMYRSGGTEDLRFSCHIIPTAKDRITIEMIHILNSVHLPLQIISFVSISLLVLLLFMYFMTPGNKDLQLKCTVCLGASMLLRLCLRLFYYLNRENPIFEDRDTCAIIAVSRIYSYLCVSFWLNTMSYELSRVVRGSLKLIPLRDLMKSKWRFPCYFIYSWGCPVLIGILILGLYLPQEFLQDSSIKPSFMPIVCLRNPFHMSTYVFSYGPIGLLFLMDTIFMAHIAYLLHKEQIMRFCSRTKAPVIQLRTHCRKNYLEWFKQRLYIYSLFVIMRIIKSVGMNSSNSTFFAVAVILTMSDVLGSMLLFFIVVKSNNYSLPKKSYTRFSTIWRKFSLTKTSKDVPKLCSVVEKSGTAVHLLRV